MAKMTVKEKAVFYECLADVIAYAKKQSEWYDDSYSTEDIAYEYGAEHAKAYKAIVDRLEEM